MKEKNDDAELNSIVDELKEMCELERKRDAEFAEHCEKILGWLEELKERRKKERLDEIKKRILPLPKPRTPKR